jgi:hypothetical protein
MNYARKSRMALRKRKSRRWRGEQFQPVEFFEELAHIKQTSPALFAADYEHERGALRQYEIARRTHELMQEEQEKTR